MYGQSTHLASTEPSTEWLQVAAAVRSSCPNRPSRVVERGQPRPSHEMMSMGLFLTPPAGSCDICAASHRESFSRCMGSAVSRAPFLASGDGGWETGNGQSSLASHWVRRISVQDTFCTPLPSSGRPPQPGPSDTLGTNAVPWDRKGKAPPLLTGLAGLAASRARGASLDVSVIAHWCAPTLDPATGEFCQTGLRIAR